MKRAVLTVLLLVFILGTMSAAYVYYYFNIRPNDKVVPAFIEGELALIIEGESITSKNKPQILEGEVLLPLETVKDHLDNNIFWDKTLEKVTITTKDRVIRMKTNNLDAIVNNKPMTLKIPVTLTKEVVYIPIEFLSDFYNIEVSYIETSNVIIIDHKDSIIRIAEPVKKDAVIRNGKTVRYPIIRKLDLTEEKPEKNLLSIFEEDDKWYRVRTWDGAIGFIEKRFVEVKSLPVEQTPEDKAVAESAWKPETGKINLVWDMVYTPRTNHSSVGEMKGLDVISPTWFQVLNANGELINRAYPKYVEWAHENGYKVWALLSNDFKDTEMTSKFLNNTDSRDNLIRQILAYASLYKLDGINIDFENMNNTDREVFTQFIRELAPFLREQGLVVSVDVNDFKCYDKKALSEAADYIMYMSYDQHWSTSPVAGSVAQITWVEEILVRVLQKEGVPKEKLLLGIPFYTRLWKHEKDTNGTIKLTSQALSMDVAKKNISENKAEVSWDEESGQFYAYYKKDNAEYKMWLEDSNSVNLRSALIQKYNLAGACIWARNFASNDIWKTLENNLKGIENYQEWVSNNRDLKYVYNK
ncbi:MAG: glycoside hydrolase [Clostridiaceae bacterium]|nr:glycoside hydrolase [Clostridiaceae bacterium]